MQLAQLILVIVMVWRAENSSGHPALRHEGVSALGWFGRGAFGLVERAEMSTHNVGNCFVFTQPKRVVQRAKEHRLNDFALGVFLHGEADRISLRLLQNKKGDVKQRKGASRHLDLT